MSFHHCVKLSFLQRSMLSMSEASIQIPQCDYRSEPPIPSCSSSRLGPPSKSLSTKTTILSTCFCLQYLSAALGIPRQISRCTFQRDKVEFTKLTSFSGPNVSLFQQDPICPGPSMKVSYKQICIVLLHLSSQSTPSSVYHQFVL